MKTTICKYIGCVVSLIALFALLMTAVYAIPNDAIECHREYSLCVLDFLDFLTFPLVSLGVPMMAALVDWKRVRAACQARMRKR